MYTPLTHTLSNGITVLFVQQDSPSVSISIRMKAGSAYEQQGEEGVAHFLEHVVHDATERFPSALSLSRSIEKLGALSNANTGYETVEYWVKARSEHLEESLTFLSEVLLHPLLKEEDIKKEKDIIAAEIKQYSDDPDSVVWDTFHAALFAEHPYGKPICGTEEQVRAITRDTLHTFRNRFYLAEQTVIALCGGFNPHEALTLLEGHFGAMPQDNSPIELSIPTYATEVTTKNRADLGHAHLVLGVPAPHKTDPLRYAVGLFSTVLGKGATSRLFQELREKRGLVYDVSADYAPFTKAGYTSMSLSCLPEKIEECMKVSRSEVEKLAINGVDEEEFRQVQNQVLTSYLFGLETNHALASLLTAMHFSETPQKTIEDEIRAYQAVTPEHIQQAAEEFISHTPAIALVSPETVADELHSFW